jgi:hypothetical protein
MVKNSTTLNKLILMASAVILSFIALMISSPSQGGCSLLGEHQIQSSE